MKLHNGQAVTREILQAMVNRRLENMNKKRSRWETIRPVGRELRQFTLELIEECLSKGFFVRGK